MENQLVVFELANEHYGVDIAAVESIIKMQPITAVPHTASYVDGVTNLRGNVLPVLDLRRLLGLNTPDPNPKNGKDSGDGRRIVVVALDGLKVGMIVDAVTEVLRVPQDAFESPPQMVTSVDKSYITGIAKVGERLIILLDISSVLEM